MGALKRIISIRLPLVILAKDSDSHIKSNRNYSFDYCDGLDRPRNVFRPGQFAFVVRLHLKLPLGVVVLQLHCGSVINFGHGTSA